MCQWNNINEMCNEIMKIMRKYINEENEINDNINII